MWTLLLIIDAPYIPNQSGRKSRVTERGGELRNKLPQYPSCQVNHSAQVKPSRPHCGTSAASTSRVVGQLIEKKTWEDLIRRYSTNTSREKIVRNFRKKISWINLKRKYLRKPQKKISEENLIRKRHASIYVRRTFKKRSWETTSTEEPTRTKIFKKMSYEGLTTSSRAKTSQRELRIGVSDAQEGPTAYK